jgi:molecular chaperone DnaK (HSP70)
VFEPHAAAAASLAFSNAPTRFVLVFDMGAGTTDIAAFEFDETVDPPALSEIKEARQCSALAGDEIDRILIGLLFRKRGQTNSEDQQRALRSTRLSARDLKRDLFAQGRCALRNGWIATTIKIGDMQEDPQFRQYLAALADTIAKSLAATVRRAEEVGAEVVDVVLAGGGSHLPFLPELVRVAAQRVQAHVRLRIGPLSPANALYQGVDTSLRGVFPQIAMSVGGALVEMLDRPAAA